MGHSADGSGGAGRTVASEVERVGGKGAEAPFLLLVNPLKFSQKRRYLNYFHFQEKRRRNSLDKSNPTAVYLYVVEQMTSRTVQNQSEIRIMARNDSQTRTSALSIMEYALQQIKVSLESGDAKSAQFHLDNFDSNLRRVARAYETTPAGLADDARSRAMHQESIPLRGEVKKAQEAAAVAAERAAAEAAQRALTMVTEAQIDYLRILGYTGSTKDLTKREASSLIDSLKNQRGGHNITAEDNDDPEAFESVRRALL